MPSIVARHPLGDQVYLQLLQRIESGSLATGSKLRDAAIANELGVSRTPVREALVRLAREGVLSAEPGRGFRLTSMSSAELRDGACGRARVTRGELTVEAGLVQVDGDEFTPLEP